MRINTGRLTLSDLEMWMAGPIYVGGQDETLRRFLPDEAFDDLAEAEAAVRRFIAGYQEGSSPQVHAVLRGQTCVGYVEAARLGAEWEIGYHIFAPHRGQGYAAEALQAYLPYIRRRTGAARLLGVTLEENAASIRVLEKSGFALMDKGEGEYQGARRAIRRYAWTGRKDG